MNTENVVPHLREEAVNPVGDLLEGADGHSREGILRALIAAPLEGIDTFTALHHR
ncbi:hypothetical protein HMPREF1015_01287, partial [Bacillus smithii 7_3_47FAA]